MSLPFIHSLLGTLLILSVVIDVFVLRSSSSLVLEPREWIESWRKKIAIIEMILIIFIFYVGFSLWLPAYKSYPGAIFHLKILSAVLFLLLGKIRMLSERSAQKKGLPFPSKSLLFTRLMFICVSLNWLLGSWWKLN